MVSPHRASNRDVADLLERVADLLEGEEANPFRVRSYRRAAEEIRALSEPLSSLYETGGRERLEDVPGVGKRLSGAIAEILDTGRLGLLERLESERSPADRFARLPGLGPELAGRIVEDLGVTTLEDLERAAHDGRLEGVEGIGPKRAQGIRDALAGILGRSSRRRRRERLASGVSHAERPSVRLLLDVDAEYREKAEAGELRRIAPRRFNPKGEAWLPVMEVKRDGWELRPLFSNTARAHDLGKTHDWVVIYYDRDGEHGQATVVTAGSGALAGERVVRGREPECRACYRGPGAGGPSG